MLTTSDLRIDVGDGVRTAVHLYRPDPANAPERPVVAFAFPGGGYSRRYFDIDHDDGSYSEARFHTDRGWTFVSCDHLGVGDSDHPDPDSLTLDALAEANDATVRGVLAELDVEPALVLGMGQSMGGCLTIISQGVHRTFDAIAVLGFSASHTMMPTPNGLATVKPVERGRTDAADVAISAGQIGSLDVFRWAFHTDDTDPALVDADLEGGYPLRVTAPHWGSITMPPSVACMLTEGIVAKEAAMIDVPVFVGCGQRDVVPYPRTEPASYSSSNDITVHVVENMAHMHNFARTRAVLWERLHGWAECLRTARAAQPAEWGAHG